MRKPHAEAFAKPLAVADRLLYRRGNFNGTMDELICDALRQELDAEIALSPGFRWGASVLTGETITAEDLLTETAMTYPEVYIQTMTGEQIKAIMEDVCDNLFNADPYYQQGGDMVRIGGMAYACAPHAAAGSRISDIRLADGRAIEASKAYRVAGWASVNEQQGAPVWEVVSKFLQSGKHGEARPDSGVTLKGVDGNPGLGEAG
jgi:sulfur-oxidizing protein SoxB